MDQVEALDLPVPWVHQGLPDLLERLEISALVDLLDLQGQLVLWDPRD